jgi:hypothetical protein
VPFLVDLTAAVSVGEIALDAVARGGVRRGGESCAGAPEVDFGEVTDRWTIGAPALAQLRIESMHASPMAVRAGNAFTLNVGVRNDTLSTVVVESIQIHSSPAGVWDVPSPLSSRRLDSGQSGMYSISGQTDVQTPAGTRYSLSVTVIARDDAGNLYASVPGDITASIDVTRP